MNMFGDDSDLSFLQLFWGGQTVMVGTAAAAQMAVSSFKNKEKDGVKSDDQPRGWFEFHKRLLPVYISALIWTSWTSWSVFGSYCWDRQPNEHLTSLLTTLTLPHKSVVDSTSTVITTGLFQIYLIRRIYENFAISIFSHHQVVGPLQLLLTYAYHIGVALSLFAESPSFGRLDTWFNLGDLRWYHLVGLSLYLTGSVIQHRALQLLATLRKNRAGHIVTTAYKLPKGGLFDLVSCPHYLGEIILYCGLGLTLGLHSRTWWMLTSYVFMNQLQAAYNTHKFYQEKFPDYPKTRKMLIPYLL